MSNKLSISDRLAELLNAGAVLYTPSGQYPLAYAWHAPDWSALLLLYIADGQLVEWRLSPTAYDYDARTHKLYVAYSPKDYIQVRPGDTAQQRAVRINCFKTQVETMRMDAADAALIINTVLRQPDSGSAAAQHADDRLPQMDLRQLGAGLLLLKRWSHSSAQWKAWLRSTIQG